MRLPADAVLPIVGLSASDAGDVLDSGHGSRRHRGLRLMSNIVSISGGGEIAPPYEPIPKVVEIAEKILEMARAGEIQGLTAFLQHSDDTFTCRRGGDISYRLIGIMTVVTADLANRMNE